VRASHAIFLIVTLLAISCVFELSASTDAAISKTTPPQGKEKSMFELKSNAFHAQGNIPSQFTCEGQNISPELSWSGAPEGTKTFALVLHDPDAPHPGGYTHWVAFNIPATVNHVAENAPKNTAFPRGGVQGKNDAGKNGYTGPCPPSGTHRYNFHLYAVDGHLELSPAADKQALEKALKGHVLGQTELMGRYKKGTGKAA
jgi:Raf kinase inhibitor-like YbhB/YbcL family protein